jgi:hypothetical protein
VSVRGRAEGVRRGLILVLHVMALGFMAWKYAEVSRHGVGGFNLRLYRYLVHLDSVGVSPFRGPAAASTDPDDSFRDPRYADVTGLQVWVYRGLVAFEARTGVDGFVAGSFVMLYAALAVVTWLAWRRRLGLRTFVLFVLLFLSRGLWYRLFERSYEDKALYLLVPVLLYAVSLGAGLCATAALAGIGTALVGIPAFLFAAVLLDHASGTPTRGRREIVVASILFLAAFALGMIPYFPESLTGWRHRFELEASPTPIWFSIWQLLPAYPAHLNRAVILGCTGLTTYALFRRRLDLLAGLVLIQSYFFVFSITAGGQRVIPSLILLVLAFDRSPGRSAVFAAAGLVFLNLEHRWFNQWPRTPPAAALQAAALHAPMLLAYALLAVPALARRVRPSGIAAEGTEAGPQEVRRRA